MRGLILLFISIVVGVGSVITGIVWGQNDPPTWHPELPVIGLAAAIVGIACSVIMIVRWMRS
jgi:hypothetical protein